jgi:DNA polymerase III subunit delta'
VSGPAVLPAPAWVSAHTAVLAQALKAGRLPHALLIHEAPGAGGEWLASWVAQLVLCQERAQAPCGRCTACRRVAGRQHPDLNWVGLEEESRELRIDQVRNLAADLALKSHGGGYKVGVITPADSLNRFAANALLKTLEEPPGVTLLVLVATQPSRLPPTVRSRCQRLRIRAPTRAESLDWLAAAKGAGDWSAALDALGEAPMLLIQGDAAELAEIGADCRRTLDALAEGSADPVSTAERWARAAPALRLVCFENWLTERIRRAQGGGSHLTEVRSAPYLSAGNPFLNIRQLFWLLDGVREMRAALDAPLNKGLALEVLFRQLTPAYGGAGEAQG